MITLIISTLLSILFAVLSGFHFYWLFGGHWGLDYVIPQREEGKGSHNIPPMATLLVALGLLLFSALYASHLVPIVFPEWLSFGLLWFIPAIFSLRVIGDFNYVGLFKKVKKTSFASADNRVFIPICLCVSVLGFSLVFLAF